MVMSVRKYVIVSVKGRAAAGPLAWALLVAGLTVGWADPGRVPGPAVVGQGRADHLYLPDSPLTAKFAYPEGKIDYKVVTTLLSRAVTAWSGEQEPEEFWRQHFGPNDRVGLMIDVQEPPIPIIVVEAIIEQLVLARVRTDDILIFSGDERDLFAAGFSLRHDRPGVKCYGAASVGYRHGLTRILADMCDKVINLAYLHPHSQLGMAGAIYNHLSCVPPADVKQVVCAPQQLASVAAQPLVRQKVIFHFLLALHPYYAVPSAADEHPRWEYAGLLLSSDPVALDTVGLDILTAKRREVGLEPAEPEAVRDYLQAACDEHFLGQSNPDQITVVTIGPEE